MTAERVLQGENTRLRPIALEDMPRVARWLNTPEVRHWLHHSERTDATAEAVERFMTNADTSANVHWIIETLEGRPIGYLRLLDIDQDHRRCELAISIGELDCLGSGYGTDAVRQSLRFAFEDLGLRRVDLITDADNARGIRCYEKCGFVREGLLRARRLRHGRPVDMVIMGALKDDYAEQRMDDG